MYYSMYKHSPQFLEVSYIYGIKTPSWLRSRENRFDYFKIFTKDVLEYCGGDLIAVDDQPYDWYHCNSRTRISVKMTAREFLPRPHKNNIEMYTNPRPIQLANVTSRKRLNSDTFDLLLVIVTQEDAVGWYLYTMNQVQNLLRESPIHNKNCDINGFDGCGQIKMYSTSTKDCATYIASDHNFLRKMREKHRYAKSDEFYSERVRRYKEEYYDKVRNHVYREGA